MSRASAEYTYGIAKLVIEYEMLIPQSFKTANERLWYPKWLFVLKKKEEVRSGSWEGRVKELKYAIQEDLKKHEEKMTLIQEDLKKQGGGIQEDLKKHEEKMMTLIQEDLKKHEEKMMTLMQEDLKKQGEDVNMQIHELKLEMKQMLEAVLTAVREHK